MEQWGYSSTFERSDTPFSKSGLLTRYSHKEWLPIYTDHAHPVNGVIPDFATRIPHSPCDKSAIKSFNGKLEVTSTGTPVMGDNGERKWSSSHIIEIKKSYTLKPVVTQNWRYFKVDQGMYLNKWIAAKNNLRIYLIGEKGNWVKGPIYPHWDRKWMPKLKTEPLAESGNQVECGDWLENSRCAITTSDIASAIFIWNHKGKDIGFSIHREDYNAFYGSLARTLNLRCDNAANILDKKGNTSIENLERYHTCGNLEWHTMIAGSRDLARIPKTTKVNQLERYEMVYSVGTFKELIQLTEDKIKTLRILVHPNGIMEKVPRIK